MITAALLALTAGMSIPLGALISSNVHLRSICVENKIDSFVSYFGGGALLAAISLVLLPYGLEHSSILTSSLSFIIGGLVFWRISILLGRSGTSASQFTGMLLDFIPESVVLGASIVTGTATAYLLAILITLQNMPEGFASYHEMKSSGVSVSKLRIIFLGAPLLGPVSALAGYIFLSANPSVLSSLMLFCSGGILYLVFENIAPEAKLEEEHFPAVGSICGFLLGIIGTSILH